MPIARLVIVALSMAVLCDASSTAAPPQRLRVLSYNIHHGEGVDGRLDLERIAAVIRAAEPDVVALQEVDSGARRSGGADQPAELARLTGMHVLFGKNIDHDGGAYGNAVLAKRPPTLIENIVLPSLLNDEGVDDREQRGALTVEIPLDAGAPLVFIATHLDARGPDAERLASAQALNYAVKERFADRPVILAGDLNATPESAVLKRFSEIWQNSTVELPTVPVGTPRRQIDFVLVRPPDQWRTIEARVLDETVASDHRPLLVVLELTKGQD